MLTEEQLTLRRQGITGSEIASIAGYSPYGSPLEVWSRKTGRSGPTARNDAMDRGNALEPAIRSWYADVTGYVVTEPGTLVWHENPLIIATPDGAVETDSSVIRALEIKCPTPRTYDQWGEEGTDEIPPQYIPQCLWEAAVLNVSQTDVAVDLGDHLAIYHVPFDRPTFDYLVSIAERFWHDHVLTGIAPAAVGMPNEPDVIRSLHPTNSDESYLEADRYNSDKISAYKTACEEYDTAEKEKNRLRADLQLTIGDKSGIKSQFGRLDYKCNKDSIKVDWEAVARELGADKSVIDKHSEIKPGARVFRAYWKR